MLVTSFNFSIDIQESIPLYLLNFAFFFHLKGKKSTHISRTCTCTRMHIHTHTPLPWRFRINTEENTERSKNQRWWMTPKDKCYPDLTTQRNSQTVTSYTKPTQIQASNNPNVKKKRWAQVSFQVNLCLLILKNYIFHEASLGILTIVQERPHNME